MTQKASLSITDNRTRKTYEIPISHNAIHAPHFKQITAPDADTGLLVSDPGLRNTAVVESEVAYLYEQLDKHQQASQPGLTPTC